MKIFDSEVLSAALDESVFDILDHVMNYFGPEPPFLCFGAPGAARVLSGYGRTVLADRDAFTDPFGSVHNEDIEVRVAGPEDPLVFPPGRFGLVHLRWRPLGGSVLPNAIRWLKYGGVLLVETPDAYPAESLPRGPYQAVAAAVADRLRLPGSLGVPGILMRHGLEHVGCRHESPAVAPFHMLFRDLIGQGMPFEDLEEADLRDWPKDPVASTPAFMNVVSWGLKVHK